MPNDEQLVAFFKALTNRNRRAIIRHLKIHGEASVTDIARGVSVSMTTASSQLMKLSDAQLLDGRKDGKRMLYRLSSTLSRFEENSLKSIL